MSKRLRVLALASYPIESASSRYRITQFIEPLAARGIDVTFSPFLDASLFADLYEPRRLLQRLPRLALATLRRGQSMPPLEPAPGSPIRGRWLVEQAGGEAGQERKITVTFEPADGERRYEHLLQQAVWLSPPPDQIYRRLAKDGSQAIHEFTYSRPGVTDTPELRIASRQQFERGAYYSELTVNVVD